MRVIPESNQGFANNLGDHDISNSIFRYAGYIIGMVCYTNRRIIKLLAIITNAYVFYL